MAGLDEEVGGKLLDLAGLHRLVVVLMERGYRVIGPTLRDNAIVLAELESADDLPWGWGVDVGPGHYRLRRREDDAAFAHSAGPQSWKQFLHPSRQRIWAGTRDGVQDNEPEQEAPRYAFLGVRGCDLAAIATLDRVLGRSEYPDSAFVSRHRQIFVVAVNCTEPGDVCFCASMGTGPAAGPGYDLALTERFDGEPTYVVDIGSPEGAEVLSSVPSRPATRAEIASAAEDVAGAAQRMGRAMPNTDLRNLLIQSRESPQWDEVASRCLTCGNCTMVCPTCFCTSTEDVSDLTGEHAERWRQWSSCFEFDFTFVHGGGSVRQSSASRYRHWLTHKLGTWHDQFGMSGCVGCGRCIAWCPPGIDITAEMNKMAGND